MLRITSSEAGSGTELLRLEGSVAGQWVEELRRSCDEILIRPGGRLVLDLAGVTFIDLEGVALFHEFARRPITLTNCSPFVAEQLKPLVSQP